MIVVAVKHFDVDTSVGHPSGELTQLARHCLLESLDDHVALGDHANAGFLERRTRNATVGKEEMGDSATIDDPRPTTFDAHARTTQRFTHFSKGARSILELNCEIPDHRLRISVEKHRCASYREVQCLSAALATKGSCGHHRSADACIAARPSSECGTVPRSVTLGPHVAVITVRITAVAREFEPPCEPPPCVQPRPWSAPPYARLPSAPFLSFLALPHERVVTMPSSTRLADLPVEAVGSSPSNVPLKAASGFFCDLGRDPA